MELAYSQYEPVLVLVDLVCFVLVMTLDVVIVIVTQVSPPWYIVVVIGGRARRDGPARPPGRRPAE